MVPLVFALFLFSGCAKVNYLVEQGIGQLSLINKSKDNNKVLKDPQIPEKYKDKIKKIQEYKKYFYHYFSIKPSQIYSKTNILKQAAVTYLVISSKHDEIKPKLECFPIVGCFPYLGFFSKESAIEYSEKMQEQHYETWLRPVYAYSTLGNFNDPILSSFFYYNDYELAELIFHELFHTIFFIKDEVTLNENLASFFGEQLATEYFSYEEEKRKEVERENAYGDAYNLEIVNQVDILKKLYEKNLPLSKEKSDKIRIEFLKTSFYPALSKVCERFARQEKCKGLKVNWNNARFAAYMTYENQQSKIKQYYKKFGDLKLFLEELKNKNKEFENKKRDIEFEEYLLGVK